MRRDFYRGIIRDVHYRNGCPFAPHPDLLTHLKEWEKEHCLNHDILVNGRDIIHATGQIGLNNQHTDQLKAEAAANSLTFPTNPTNAEDPVPKVSQRREHISTVSNNRASTACHTCREAHHNRTALHLPQQAGRSPQTDSGQRRGRHPILIGRRPRCSSPQHPARRHH